MKKLLRSEICGTREQCTGALFTKEKSKHAVEGKKKKEGKRANAQNINVPCIQTDTKSLSGHSSSFCLFYLKKKRISQRVEYSNGLWHKTIYWLAKWA